VAGVVNEYMPLLPSRTSLSLQLAIHGDVPLGSGISSSAALEVAVATFLERMIRDKFPKVDLGGDKEKALRCHLFWRLKQHCRKLITKLIAQGFTHRFNSMDRKNERTKPTKIYRSKSALPNGILPDTMFFYHGIGHMLQTNMIIVI